MDDVVDVGVSNVEDMVLIVRKSKLLLLANSIIHKLSYLRLKRYTYLD